METCENGKKIPEQSRSVLGRFYCIYISDRVRIYVYVEWYVKARHGEMEDFSMVGM